MLPELARLVLAEFTLMDEQLQATVTNLPLAAVTGPSPTKAELKKRRPESMGTIEGITSANAKLSAENVPVAEDLEAEVSFWENSFPFFLCHFAIFELGKSHHFSVTASHLENDFGRRKKLAFSFCSWLCVWFVSRTTRHVNQLPL